MTSSGDFKYRRLLLKVSGEGFASEDATTLDTERVKVLASQLRALISSGVEVACVIGGGNILRGKQSEQLGIARATADYMGMLATIINGLALCDALEANGVPTRVMSSIDVHKVCEPFIRRRALRHMEKGRVVVLVGGLGSPYFTTDSTAAQRAVELGCDVLLKATMVDGVYDKDPKHHDDAVKLPDLTFDDVLARRLRVMDQTAFTLCSENDLPLVVFEMTSQDGVLRAARGEAIGTLIHN
ncbi:MAG: UMP kinase [Planctomycetes bacterium]|nr:UMP kinase [Planctomycetota bacterium]MBT4028633.1 UMP kinase [Planctomycetota bacterium]MBT4559525.1 UMP kinase [Planctomycetota bacterium]MBT5101631.1 UMP kinase [Planctomycetota bacterium]MBT5119717.1 UMP kinase [Planctomycetota bacterium]